MRDIKTDFPQLYQTLSDSTEQIAYFFGAGISVALLGGKGYSWEAWVRDGIGLLPDADLQTRLFNELGDTSTGLGKPTAATLVVVLERLIALLKGLPGVYERWMHNAFEARDLQDNVLAMTLKKLLAYQDFFVTTNYDNLLSQATGAAAASYLHPDIVYPMLKEKRNDHIIHIHGRYSSQPTDCEDSVIATDSQYNAILANQGAQFIQNVIGTRTVIFIGCGKTTSDRNISRFISFAKEHLKLDRTYYFLHRAGEEPDDLPGNVIPVCYGNDYRELPQFLEEIAKTRLDNFVRNLSFIELFPSAIAEEQRVALPVYYFAAEGLSFHGRSEELSEIEHFLELDDAFLWYAITGQSGSGKSRLALEICHRNNLNWCAFFLASESPIESLDVFEPYRDTLIVVDDFKGREKLVAEKIGKLVEKFAATSYRLRILLCERESKVFFGTWFEELERSFPAGSLPQFRSGRYGGSLKEFLQLGDLKNDELEDLIGEICAKKGLPIDHKRDEKLRKSYEAKLEQLHYRPLFLQMFVESWIDNGCSATRFDSWEELLADILKREQDRWLKELGGSYVLFEAWSRLLLLSVVAGRLTQRGIPEKYQSDFDSILEYVRVNSFPGRQRTERFISLVSDMCHGIGQEDAYIEAMYPDLIKEYCFLFYQNTDTITEMSEDLWGFSPEAFSRFLSKLFEDFPYNDLAFVAVDGNEKYRYRNEALKARVILLNTFVIQQGDDLGRIRAWVDREYEFWHQLAVNDNGADEERSIIVFAGLSMVAQQYGAMDTPIVRTIDKMLAVYSEALELKGGETLDLVKMLKTQQIASMFSVAGMGDMSEVLLGKVLSKMSTELGRELAEETKLEKLNTEIMDDIILRSNFTTAYKTLKKALEQAERIKTSVSLAYFLNTCYRFAQLSFQMDQTQYIDQVREIAEKTKGWLIENDEIICVRRLLWMVRLHDDILNRGRKEHKPEIIEIFETAYKMPQGEYCNECIGVSGVLLMNLTDDPDEMEYYRNKIRQRLDIVQNNGMGGEDLAQAYLICTRALQKEAWHRLFKREEIEDAYAIMLRYPQSESVRQVFMEMLENSEEADNRAHYLRREVLAAAINTALYNPLNFSGLKELDMDYSDFMVLEPYVRPHKKIGSNDPCPCGSGKKFKKCCKGKGLYD